MKKIIYLIAGVCLWNACKQQTPGFEVTMNLANAADGPVYVSQRVPNPTAWYTDTLNMKNGQVVFKGKVEYPRWVTFVFHQEDGDFYGSCGLFLDNSRIEISGDFKDLKSVVVRGGKANDEYNQVEQNGKQIFRRYKKLSYERNQAFKNDRRLYDSLTPLCQQAFQEVFDYITSIPGYAGSPVAAFFVSEYFNTGDMEKFEKALNGFDASMADNPYVSTARKALEAEKKTLPGRMAYDFTLSDVQGKEYKLSDFRGKYVLLEFSASWCGWCKLEIPYLKTVYENTQGKDFVMFTVNLDESREKWVEDVEKQNLPWPVVSDLKAFKSPVAVNYNVTGIPVIYLIGPDGKIQEKGLRREAMIEKINSLFNGSTEKNG